jgi:hypothetical protein
MTGPTEVELPPVATPKHLAEFLKTTEQNLAQDRYLRRGVTFTRIGRRIRYLRDDVLAYLEQNRCQCTDDPRGAVSVVEQNRTRTDGARVESRTRSRTDDPRGAVSA